ncbi:uncharacterized protein BDV14DRAFT_184686 [Aspergillus stella-maris]|uniref:uncharacterized protein n=1 Tax=Aspergillus stella-maris TaxID=1810926 RepID=UPI003CCCC33C
MISTARQTRPRFLRLLRDLLCGFLGWCELCWLNYGTVDSACASVRDPSRVQGALGGNGAEARNWIWGRLGLSRLSYPGCLEAQGEPS